MTDEINRTLPDGTIFQDKPKLRYSEEIMTDRIEVLTAEVERLREALDAAWRHATTMRNASKLVSPYPNDHAKRSIWVRSLYHEGKQLHETLKPARAAPEGKQ